jgi:nitrogen fixation NifU-like protein
VDIDNELYQEIVLEHYKSKKNRGKIENADMQMEGFNPSCGDDIFLYMKLDADDRVEKATFDGAACSICTASADMLAEAVTGKTLQEAEEIVKTFKGMLLEDKTPDFPDELSDLESLQA